MAFVRVSSQPIWFKPFNSSKNRALSTGFRLNLAENVDWWNFRSSSAWCAENSHQNPNRVNFSRLSFESRHRALETGIGAKPRILSCAFSANYSSLNRIRGFSSSSSYRAAKGSSNLARHRKPFNFRAKAHKHNAMGKIKKEMDSGSGGSSWEESAKIFFQRGSMPKVDSSDSKTRLLCMAKDGQKEYGGRNTKFDEAEDEKNDARAASGLVGEGNALAWLANDEVKEDRKVEHAKIAKSSESSWEKSARMFIQKNSTTRLDAIDGRRSSERIRNLRKGKEMRDEVVEKDDEYEEDADVVDDPRWDKIRSRFGRISETKAGTRKPEFQRWSKEENWGRKTWREATESTIPKMVGEGVYGVGPVLAALSAGRREFYTLYVQEGLDLSGNNRKKKDKKRFEKVLLMADNLGLSRKEATKHDLNMIVDSRPHQGLILDASPLEMVRIKELEPVTVEGEKPPVWLALDEVMDPQNLGAIVRSAYFFGASGVVLCAKNSAPLSGVVSKASAGSLELIELRSCKNMMQFLTASAENGWRVLGGSVSSKAIPITEVVPGSPTILVLGSEGTGLRPLVERSCTELVSIPGNMSVDVTAGSVENVESSEMDSGSSVAEFRPFIAVESLNVSVAAGVLLFHLLKSHSEKVCASSNQQISVPE